MDPSAAEIMDDEFERSSDIFDQFDDDYSVGGSSAQSVASLVVLDDSDGSSSDNDEYDSLPADNSSPLHQWEGSSSRESSEAASEDSLFVGRQPHVVDMDRDSPDDFVARVREETRRVEGLLADARARLHTIRDVNGGIEGNTGLQGARTSAAQRGRDNDRESRRHHPYRNSQQQHQQHQQDHRGNMDGNHRVPRGHQSAFDDELVEMTVAPARAASHRRTPVPNRDVIIDLTGEPSSPERDPPAAAPNSLLPSRRPPTTNRNPRRQTSFLRRTPSLARSDGSLLGNGSRTVPIDLTMDDDEPAPAPMFPPQPREPPRTEPNVNPDLGRLFRHNFLGINIQSHLSHMPRLAQALGNLVNRPMAEVDIDLIGGGVPVADPLGHNVPDLRYAFGIPIPPPRARDPPQPKHVPPPPAPEGFTRNTGGDQVIVCAGCDEELQYCPEDEDAANAANAAKQKSPAAKRAKSRKDMEEHYFWALKDCGHVYCKSCYEKRLVKKAERSPFRPAVDNNKKMICSVDDCKTEVGTKYAWVGLFL